MKRRVIEKSKEKTVVRYETDSQWAIIETRLRYQPHTYSLVNKKDCRELCVCEHYDFDRVIPIENGIGAVSFKDDFYGKVWYVINEQGNIIVNSFSKIYFPRRIKDMHNNKMIVTVSDNKTLLYRVFDKNGLISEFNTIEGLNNYLDSLQCSKTYSL